MISQSSQARICVIVMSILFGVEFVQAQKVTLAFDRSQHPQISHYNVYRSSDLDPEFVLVGTLQDPVTSYVDSSVTVGTRYSYTATAVDVNGNESGYSNIVERSIADITTSLLLTNFTAQSESGRVILQWVTNGVDAYGFEVQRRSEATGFVTIGFVSAAAWESNYSFVDDAPISGKRYYRIRQISADGRVTLSGFVEVNGDIPTTFQIRQNYPNPFNPSTAISYVIPEAGHVTLTIYNSRGQIVRQPVNEFQQSGEHVIRWNGRDAAGNSASTGTYFYKVETPTAVAVRRMTLAK